ncbi:sigma-70 family RNA polymerase sigma factor [Paenibacillus durus]|uniref:RNA polymerase sigma factor n=1 Tax=Paenibacillus durus TaxID=44251 RepID=A0A089HJ91_PAEDU|nr:sigma-70 family RNA polymerase sigma factor [Paenibacillus durus]AIQ10755.1 RNA polymerase sigma factor [Paenibacillus durus]
MFSAEMTKVTLAGVGTEVQFSDAVRLHRELLYGIACSYLRNRSDTLEAVQEAICRAWIKRATLKDPKAFKSWIIRILIYVCIDEQRRRKRTVPLEDKDLAGQVTDIGHGRLEMLSVLERIKPKYRHVLLLKYYNDLTIPDIAAILQKPEGTVKTWQHKGLKQLRAIMEEEERA